MVARIPEPGPDHDEQRFIERPDGFYWQDKRSGAEYGPFTTLFDAEMDMRKRDDDDYEIGASLSEAESEIGISDWLDPDTGEPAEESVPRIEDH